MSYIDLLYLQSCVYDAIYANPVFHANYNLICIITLHYIANLTSVIQVRGCITDGLIPNLKFVIQDMTCKTDY